MESNFKKYSQEISLPMIELRLAISLKEPVMNRKPNDTTLEGIMHQINKKLKSINTLASKAVKKGSQETTPSRSYERAKTISSKTKEALEKMGQCEIFLEKRKSLRSSKTIEKIKSQTLEEFQGLYEVLKKLSSKRQYVRNLYRVSRDEADLIDDDD